MQLWNLWVKWKKVNCKCLELRKNTEKSNHRKMLKLKGIAVYWKRYGFGMQFKSRFSFEKWWRRQQQNQFWNAFFIVPTAAKGNIRNIFSFTEPKWIIINKMKTRKKKTEHCIYFIYFFLKSKSITKVIFTIDGMGWRRFHDEGQFHWAA